MSSTYNDLHCVFSLLSAIITANLISLSKQLTNFITKLSPNYTQFNLPGFEVRHKCLLFIVLSVTKCFLADSPKDSWSKVLASDWRPVDVLETDWKIHVREISRVQ